MYKIALAQYPINYYRSESHFQDNLEKWTVKAKEGNSDLLVFPEYGSMELVSLIPKHEQMNLHQQLESLQKIHDLFLKSFIQISKKYSIYIVTPSFPLKIVNKFFNRAYIVSPSGKLDFQDKIHMTRFEEEWGISPSETDLKIFETSLGKIAIQICFDIEFPWPTSLLAFAGANLILAPSCTEGLHGLNRVHIGAKARALESQLYIGVSQVIGNAPWSQAVDINNGIAALYGPVDNGFPSDGILSQGVLNQPSWIIHEIDLSKLENVRADGQVLNFEKNSKYPWDKCRRLSLKIIDLKE